MILDRKYQGKIRLLEGVLLAGSDHILKEDLGGERVAVVDDGLQVVAIPTINCIHQDSCYGHAVSQS